MSYSRTFAPLLALWLVAASAFSQVNSASLTGLVTDPSAAIMITGAKAVAVSATTGAVRAAETNSTGYFFLANLSVGDYSITVEKAGFEKVVSNITLDAGEKGRQDFALPVGTVATVATIEATAPMLSPDDASLGSVVDNKYVTEYPLLLRSWDDLVNLVAGVQGQRYTDQGGSTSAGRTGGFNVHGIRQLENNFLLDGIDNNSIFRKCAGINDTSGAPLGGCAAGIQDHHESIFGGIWPRRRGDQCHQQGRDQSASWHGLRIPA